MESCPAWSQIVLFAPGPFFANPIKLLFARSQAASYDVAFKHFYRDHNTRNNLRLHCVCLVFQLITNCALLACIEDCFDAGPVLRGATAALWGAALSAPPSCPVKVKAASLLTIVIATGLAKYVQMGWQLVVFFQGLVVAFAVDSLILKRQPKVVSVLGVLAVWAVLATSLLRHGGVWEAQSAFVCSVALALLASLALRKDPLRSGLIHFGAFGLWILAILTGQTWLFWLGWGYVRRRVRANEGPPVRGAAGLDSSWRAPPARRASDLRTGVGRDRLPGHCSFSDRAACDPAPA